MFATKLCHGYKRCWQQASKNGVLCFALLTTGLLIACDAAVQLCGEYACVYYQTSCAAGSTCDEPVSCEPAGSIRDRVPRIINELRSANRACSANTQTQNSSRLVWDEKLASASAAHSQDMARNRFESFNGTNGLSSSERLEQEDFNAALVLENIGSGPQTAAEMINTWLDIQTDCTNMLSSDTSRMGMSCTVSEESDGRPYWSLVLARPRVNSIQTVTGGHIGRQNR